MKTVMTMCLLMIGIASLTMASIQPQDVQGDMTVQTEGRFLTVILVPQVAMVDTPDGPVGVSTMGTHIWKVQAAREIPTITLHDTSGQVTRSLNGNGWVIESPLNHWRLTLEVDGTESRVGTDGGALTNLKGIVHYSSSSPASLQEIRDGPRFLGIPSTSARNSTIMPTFPFFTTPAG